MARSGADERRDILDGAGRLGHTVPNSYGAPTRAARGDARPPGSETSRDFADCLSYRKAVSVFTSDPQWVQVTNRSPESTQSSSPQFQQIKIVLMCPKTSAWAAARRFGETLPKLFTVSCFIACEPPSLKKTQSHVLIALQPRITASILRSNGREPHTVSRTPVLRSLIQGCRWAKAGSCR